MKKILSTLIIIASFVAAYSATSVDATNASDKASKPSNVSVYVIGSGTGVASADTFAASSLTSGTHTYGPLPMSKDKNSPCYTSFRVFAPNLVTTASTGNLQVSYQQLGSNRLADTTATWVVADTVVPGGTAGQLIPLDSLPSQSIVVRLNNYGSSVTAILKKIYVVFYTNTSLGGKVGWGL
jgi:hypothetical protein